LSLWSRIAGFFSASGRGYDAIGDDDQTRNHWQRATAETPANLTTLGNRKIHRDRARYEVRNNSYANGVGHTLCNFTIGTGPRVQILGDDQEAEQAFADWMANDRFAEKLRQLRFARYESGEGFLVRSFEARDGVSLTLVPVECDRITGQEGADGIKVDAGGKPVSYEIRDEIGWKSITVEASQVIHYFRADRPGQLRGIPEVAPALPLFAQLRNYTLSVLNCAESAARPAGVIQSNSNPTDEDADEDPATYDKIEVPRGAGIILPKGYAWGQIDPKQPTTTYPEFKREILSEIGRCLNVPANLMLGDSSAYNFASGRLDHQTFFVAISVEQDVFERITQRVFGWFWEEWALLRGLDRTPPPIKCYWDAPPPVDPLKEASAQAMRLDHHTSTLADEYARRGLDWEEQLRQRAKELARMAELEREFEIKFDSQSQITVNNAPEDNPEDSQRASDRRGKEPPSR
jgi:capsid protein